MRGWTCTKRSRARQRLELLNLLIRSPPASISVELLVDALDPPLNPPRKLRVLSLNCWYAVSSKLPHDPAHELSGFASFQGTQVRSPATTSATVSYRRMDLTI